MVTQLVSRFQVFLSCIQNAFCQTPGHRKPCEGRSKDPMIVDDSTFVTFISLGPTSLQATPPTPFCGKRNPNLLGLKRSGVSKRKRSLKLMPFASSFRGFMGFPSLLGSTKTGLFRLIPVGWSFQDMGPSYQKILLKRPFEDMHLSKNLRTLKCSS